jgi:Fic family protein
MSYRPPFKITNTILLHLQAVSKALGFLAGAKLEVQPTKLRKDNKIKTIQSSLAIEGNSLSTDQITAVLSGKRVLASKKDILEVQNAIQVYDQLSGYRAESTQDFLSAHKLLMQGLIEEAGVWRSGGVGIFKESKVAHMAPQAKKVNGLMKDLFAFIKSNKDISWLIKACVFHYELEFIHPFSDGNGRMGRLWQQVLLMKEDSIFEYIPIEMLIREHQEEYYKVLSKCDKLGHSTLFLEYMLEKISYALQDYSENMTSSIIFASDRMEYALKHFGDKIFSRKDYIKLHKDISTATASRDLKYATENNILEKIGKKNQTMYKFQSRP